MIATVSTPVGSGAIGITICPGKKDPSSRGGAWDRDLRIDVAAICDWGADAVVCLLEDREFDLLEVPDLHRVVESHGLDWVHLPITDASVPDDRFETGWTVEGPRLAESLISGGRVLVHCRGGLGRSGLIAARLLIELGVRADEAIRQVRAARPGAIETSAQEAHVRAARPVAGSGATARRSHQPATDRAVGCLLGLAVGDAVGTALEFKARDRYPPLTDMVGGGPFDLEPGEWTDDTSMALCLADSLIACGGLDQRDLMERFVRWYKDGENAVNGRCFDIGKATRNALERFIATGEAAAGDTNPQSAGNGSVMRLAPVALRWHRDPTEAVRAARRQSVTTHAAAAAVAGCALLAESLVDAIATGDKNAALKPRTSEDPSIQAIAAGSWRGKDRAAISSTGYVVHTLEAALWAVDQAEGFEQAVLLAANLGCDADTVAAVTGQLAGALWGVSGIPGRWLDRLAWRDEIERRALALISDPVKAA